MDAVEASGGRGLGVWCFGSTCLRVSGLILTGGGGFGPEFIRN